MVQELALNPSAPPAGLASFGLQGSVELFWVTALLQSPVLVCVGVGVGVGGEGSCRSQLLRTICQHDASH